MLQLFNQDLQTLGHQTSKELTFDTDNQLSDSRDDGILTKIFWLGLPDLLTFHMDKYLWYSIDDEFQDQGTVSSFNDKPSHRIINILLIQSSMNLIKNSVFMNLSKIQTSKNRFVNLILHYTELSYLQDLQTFGHQTS